MERTKLIKIKGDTYDFVMCSDSTRNGFSHYCELFKNNCRLAEHKVNYINRTWERYNYQTCMLGCVRELIARKYSFFKEVYKEQHNISKISKKHKECVDAEFEKLDEIKALHILIEKIDKEDIRR